MNAISVIVLLEILIKPNRCQILKNVCNSFLSHFDKLLFGTNNEKENGASVYWARIERMRSCRVLGIMLVD